MPGSGQLSYPNFGPDRADRSLSHPDVYLLARVAEAAAVDFRVLVVLRGAQELLVGTVPTIANTASVLLTHSLYRVCLFLSFPHHIPTFLTYI